MTLVPLIDLKFPNEFAACGAGTSNRQHETHSSGEDVTGQRVKRAIVGRERIERAATCGAERLAQARPGRLCSAGRRADRVDRLKSATVVRLHLHGRLARNAT